MKFKAFSVVQLVAGCTMIVMTANAGAQDLTRKPATETTRQVQQEVLERYDFSDREDFDLASRGFIADLPNQLIRDEEGHLIRDYRGWGVFEGEAPDTVNPALWRLAQVQSATGLYQVSDRIYQMRGYDLANMSIIVGETGYILVDPFMAEEVAEAALVFLREQLGDKPVTGVILTHAHTDHYGGVRGVVSAEEAASGEIPVIAPAGFLDSVSIENIMAGPAMFRRTGLAFGFNIGMGPRESVSYGLGPAYETGLGPGTTTLVEPSIEIGEDGQRVTVDGLEMEFLFTPGAEAPTEMVFFIPELNALCVSEMANATLHNVLTLRGARVRDALLWADYLTEMDEVFGTRTDVMFGSHFWPRFGNEDVREFLGAHRDMYKYLHDQTVRMINNGMTMREIAEEIELPESIGRYWFNREYYGTLSHNSKAIYQHYVGWYDANPANLNRHTPVTAASRYVEALGGPERTIALARNAFDEGDYRWSSELLNHLIFAHPEMAEARALQADSFEQMGYQAESAMWRSAYLSAAAELRAGETASHSSAAGMQGGIPLENLLNLAAVRLDPALSDGDEIVLAVRDSESGERRVVTLRHDVLVQRISDDPADVQITATADAIGQLIGGSSLAALEAAGDMTVEGDRATVERLVSYLPAPKSGFNIVTP
jgi:alkyl sulfatase BDS1-like metallo-beta-lactamase superfamily hydrolase